MPVVRDHNSSPCGGIGGLWAPSFMSIMMKVLTIVRTQMSLCRGLRGAQRAPLSPLHNDTAAQFFVLHILYLFLTVPTKQTIYMEILMKQTLGKAVIIKIK